MLDGPLAGGPVLARQHGLLFIRETHARSVSGGRSSSPVGSGSHGRLQHRRDARHLALDQLLQAGRPAIGALSGAVRAELDVALGGRWIVERLVERIHELVDDRLRRALGRHHGVPGAEDEVDAGFLGGRHVGQGLQPRRRRHRIGLDGAALDLRDDVQRLVDHVVDLAADEIVEGRRRAAIGHQRGLEAELGVEHRARHMGDRADAGMAVAQLVAVGLEVGEELLEVLGRGVLLGDDRLRRVVGDADLLEAGRRVVLEVGVERGRRRLRAHVADAEGVAIGRRRGDARHARRAAGAADVLDHQLLAQRARHVLAEDARDDVGGPAGRERHDHVDRLIGI